jgi:DNA-directed RNA polymerase specialized sigma24 family protein
MLYGRASFPPPAAAPAVADADRVGWDRLLAFLDRTARGGARGGTAYEQVRARLIRFFRVCGAAAPEELADATFDRVARKLAADLDGTDLHPAYPFGVARLIWRESLRRERTHRRGVDRLRWSVDDPGDGAVTERELRLWERCLDELPVEERSLLVDYHRGSGQPRIERRQALAAALGINAGLLRARIHRLRLQLERRIAELRAACVIPFEAP